jgi:hypothetical protein
MGKFGAQQDDLRGVIDPDQQNDERGGRAIGRGSDQNLSRARNKSRKIMSRGTEVASRDCDASQLILEIHIGELLRITKDRAPEVAPSAPSI